MNYEVKKLEKSAVEVKLHLTAEEVKPIVDKVLTHVGEHAEVAGFRKGHAPKEVLMANYKDHIESDVANDAINANFPEIVDKEKLEPVSYVRLKEINLKDDLNLTFDIDVYPQFELGNYKGLEAEKKSFEMTDDLLNEELEIMVRNHAKLEEVEDAGYKAQLNDTVDLAFEGFMDGVPFPGGKAESHLLKLGSKSFIDNFEEQLVGYTKGQEGEITVKFPDEYHAPELAGKPAQFKVKINAIKKLRQPELNDEFAKEASSYETIEELKKDLRTKMEEEASRRAIDTYNADLIQTAVKNATVEIPEVMIKDRVEQMIQELAMNMEGRGLKLDDYLKFSNKTIEDLRSEYKDSAAENVRADLVLDAIATAEGIEVTPDDMNREIFIMAQNFGADPKEVWDIIAKEGRVAMLAGSVARKKAARFIIDNAKGAEAAE